MISAPSGPWTSGCDSYSDATQVADTAYRWGVNIVSKGGIPRTRPGFNCIPTGLTGIARGMTIFTPKDGIPHIVIAVESKIYTLEYPFDGSFSQITGLAFDTTGPIVFCSAIQNVTEAADGTLTLISPIPILMIGDGETRTGYWDGLNARHLDPTKAPNGPSETPPMLWMQYSGNRLWGCAKNSPLLRASNIVNPLKFTEEDVLTEGGSLTLPANITGLGQAPDFQSLIVFTDQTTSRVQSSILQRELWQTTNGFQTMLLPGIGCASGKSITIQYGITWWYSHGGLIGLDQAVQTYRTSRIHFQDQSMNWSKSNLSPDITGICVGTYGNYLSVSVPSGDLYNAHSWILDQSWALDQSISDAYAAIRSPSWNGIFTGIRPVEWANASINGINRCFALSMDYLPSNSADNTTGVSNGANVRVSVPVPISNAPGYPVGTTTMNLDSDFARVGQTFTVVGEIGSLVHTITAAASTSITFTPALISPVVDQQLIVVVQIFQVSRVGGGGYEGGTTQIGLSGTGVIDNGQTFTIDGEAGQPIHTVTHHTEIVVGMNPPRTSGITFTNDPIAFRPLAGINVWEIFTKAHVDVGPDSSDAIRHKRIGCSLETKVLGKDDNYKDFRYVEIDCEDVSGTVDVTVSFAPLRGGYKSVLTKTIQSSQWNVVNGTTVIAIDTFQWNSYRLQSRVIRGESNQEKSIDSGFEGVESEFTRATDRGFSILVEWIGKMSIRNIRMSADPLPQNVEGFVEKIEDTDRRVQMSGAQSLETTTPPTPDQIGIDGDFLISSYSGPTSRRWTETLYQSLT